ncbi:MAG: DUF3054 domain-containing protein [Anaerolineae bacterium]|nr:MAG: DUF3054 domain-containing protein [Anaerolineae bacterium]
MRTKAALILGDVIAIAIVTVIGFASHGELGSASLWRLAATFFPLTLSWFLVAPWLGLFDPRTTAQARLLWRPAWAMLLAAPLAAFLRSLMLGGLPVLPLFVAVLGATSALGMSLWRALWWRLTRTAS